MDKTIFYGNGINYHPHTAGNFLEWKKLLEKIMSHHVFETKFLPNTMAYERIRLNWINDKTALSLSHIKDEIAKLLRDQPPNPYYQELINIGCKNYITTNYDYAFNKTFKEYSNSCNQKSESTEELYSIRRKTQLSDDVFNFSLWNVHGELDHPKSIMLGLNHYCGSVGKIDAYLKGTYDFKYKGQKNDILKIEDKLQNDDFDGHSWIELFFKSNLHILGFGLDFSEIDLWWLITKRARLIENGLIKNEIYYYTKPIRELELEVPKETDESKRNDLIVKMETEKRKLETLTDLNINVVEVPINSNYPLYYKMIFEKIKTSS